MMNRIIGLLMVVGMSGCGKDSPFFPTEPSEEITKLPSLGNSVQQTVDGGFIVTGRSDYHALLLKTDGQGFVYGKP